MSVSGFPLRWEQVDELLVNANDVYSNILTIKFHSFEHVESPLGPSSFLEKTIKVATSRITACDARSGDDDWMDGLSVADVMRQILVGATTVLTSDGILRTLEGLEYEDSSSGTSGSLPSESSNSSGSNEDKTVTTSGKPLA